MLSVHALANGAISAKAKAMYGQRLKKSDYDELVRKRSVSEIASYLKNETSYGEALKDIHEMSVHRGQLEEILRRHVFMKLMKLLRFAGKKSHSFYNLHLHQVEIDHILSCVRALNTGQFMESIADMPLFLDRYTKVNFIKLAKATSYDELLDAVKKSMFYKILLDFRVEKGETIPYTKLEIVLQKAYYHHVFEIVEKSFKGKTKEGILHIYKTNVELSNIMKIYRYKKFFQAEPHEIKESLLDVRSRLSSSMLSQLVEATSAEEMLKLLEKSSYQLYVDEQDFVFIEYYGEQIKYHLARRYMNYSTAAPLVFCAFYFLSQLEIENLFNIIEGVRYHVASEEIERMLIY